MLFRMPFSLFTLTGSYSSLTQRTHCGDTERMIALSAGLCHRLCTAMEGNHDMRTSTVTVPTQLACQRAKGPTNIMAAYLDGALLMAFTIQSNPAVM